jgi:Arc/MetJ-type ribon-helix-helix transcriptional regulator
MPLAMATPIDMQIRAAVDNFVNDVASLVRQAAVERVTVAFGDNGAGRPSRRRGPGRPRKSAVAARTGRARRKGQKRSPKQIQELQNRLLAAIKKTPGLRKEQLASELGAPSKDLMLVTNKLLADGAIRKRGAKRDELLRALTNTRLPSTPRGCVCTSSARRRALATRSASVRHLLPEDLQAFAEERVHAGEYASVGDVVRDALEQKKLAALRAAPDVGLNELDAGQGVETTPDELVDEISTEVGLDP